jgi:Right handed beta helix region
MPQSVRRVAFAFVLAVVSVAFAVDPAAAASQRSFVSTSGVDNPVCSVAAPCRSFGAAVTATNAGGEVIVLDSGGYGPVTITQPVYAGISVSSGDGVTVTTASAGDRVTLRGLTINNQGSTGSGIVFNGVGRLVVSNTVVTGFASLVTSHGLWFHPTASSTLQVENSEFRANYLGVDAEPQGPAAVANVMLDNVTVVASTAYGIYIQNASVASVHGAVVGNSLAGLATNSLAGTTPSVSIDASELSGNGYGAWTGGDAGIEQVSIQNSNLSNNSVAGIRADDGSSIRVAYSAVTQNATGLVVNGTGKIISMGNNWVQGNTANGAPTQTLGGT